MPIGRAPFRFGTTTHAAQERDSPATFGIKIIATVGPSCASPTVLREMARAGMCVARLNASHGSAKERQTLLEAARAAQKKLKIPFATLLDLKGPEVRTANPKPITLTQGGEIVLAVRQQRVREGAAGPVLSLSGIRTLAFLRRGMRVFLNDGAQILEVTNEGETQVKARVVVGGDIAPRRGVQFPDATTALRGITAQDARDIAWGAKMGFDAVAVSFVKNASDIRRARSLVARYDSRALLIAKIETAEALNHFQDILRLSDGIMVARGDLALAIPAERVPVVQKELVREARAAGKYAIVATQMLETMTRNPSPTRAEISDVANAVLDGADALMLSAETAIGDYPVAAVETMRRIARETQMYKEPWDIPLLKNAKDMPALNERISLSVAGQAARLARDVGAACIVAFTETGTTARLVSRSQGGIPILVVSQHADTLRQAMFGYGLIPATRPARYTKRSRFSSLARAAARASGLARANEPIVVISGSIFGKPGETNTLTVIAA
ncbi:MAG: pyruvate kinase [Candidatus Parcubacteria bacterium]|nr:MAG: pyruvate kinase [Candidatus Parcubacteria bacterium]